MTNFECFWLMYFPFLPMEADFMSHMGKHKKGRCYAALEGVSMTKQSFADECNVDKIIDRFVRTGVPPTLEERIPYYDDVSSVPMYDEALRIVQRAESAFVALDAKVRAQFGNDPAQFLAFCSDPANREAMKDMGLLSPEVVARDAAAAKAEQQEIQFPNGKKKPAVKPAAEPPWSDPEGGE